jgi:dTDP-4-dehydrorhamnose reductase
MQFSKDTRIYIAGCGGMLGEAVYGRFSPITTVCATDIDVNADWLGYADVREYKDIKKSVSNFAPDVVMNLAALTDMEYCEKNPEDAWLTNALGAENIALLAADLEIPYVYISTAGIFGGEKESFHDYDTPNPLSCYAKSKYQGELAAKQLVRKHYVVRAGWMMGGGPRKDKKFINKIYRQIMSGARQLHVVDDKLGTPTYTVDFAEGLKTLCESELYGTYNQVCEGSCSRYDVALEFIRLLGLEKDILLKKVTSDFFAEEYFAPRPPSEKLVCLKLKARDIYVMRDWKTCLGEYSNRFIEDLKTRDPCAGNTSTR